MTKLTYAEAVTAFHDYLGDLGADEDSHPYLYAALAVLRRAEKVMEAVEGAEITGWSIGDDEVFQSGQNQLILRAAIDYQEEKP